jgi:putative phosphoribosyl transferase
MPKNSDSKIFFDDRIDAAQQLIDDMPIESFKQRDVVVMAVSEGGVIIANAVAHAMDAQMDILLSEPIYAPKNPELPIAMVSETKELVTNRALVDSFGIDEDYVYAEAERQYEDKVLKHIYRYRHGDSIQSVKGKTVVLVDECVETGITILVAIKSMISLGAKNVYVASPILGEIVYENLIPVCDGVFCPHRIKDYISIEYYYEKLEKPTFEEIERIMETYE